MSPVPGTSGNPLSEERSTLSKGYAQATSTTTATLLSALVTIPAGATHVKLYSTALVRVRDDGSAPTATVGYTVPATTEWTYDGNKLSALQVINAATVDCWFFS